MNVTVPDRPSGDDLAFHWHPGLLAALLRCDRLTIVHAPPGATRDAMLQQVLLPLLGRRTTDCPRDQMPPQPTVLPIVEQRRPRTGSRRNAELVLRFDAWGESPLAALRERIALSLPMAWPGGAPATLADHLRQACRAHDVQLLLVLDAFERHLAQPLGRRAIARFDAQFIDWMQHADVPAHVLLLVDGAHGEQLQRYATALPAVGHGWLRAAAEGDRDTSPAPLRDRARVPAAAPVRLLPPTPAAPSTAPHAPTAPPVQPAPAPAAGPDIRAAPDDHFGAPPRVSPAVLAATRPVAPAVAPVAAPVITAVRHPAANDNERPVEKAPLRWPRQVANAALVVAGAWMLGVWLLGHEEPGVRTVAGDGPREGTVAPAPAAPTQAAPTPTPGAPTSTVVPTPPVAAPPATAPPVATTPPATTAPPAAAPAPPPAAATAVTAAPAASWQLTIARPVEGGSAPWLIDELARRVAAPAAITLQYAAPGSAAPLAVWRHDALVATREDGRGPLRVLAPLYNEQIQVLVRADSRWRWLHQLQGLHLNVGVASGARARTADTLYRRLYGRALPGWDTDHSDEVTALRRLLGDRSIDAMLVVAESPVLATQPPAVRERLRLLQVDPEHRSTASVLRSYLALRGPQPNAPPVLAVTSFLVAPTAASADTDPALRALVAALCRARPALQAQASPLLRGIDPRVQPSVGWPYLIPMRDGSADCPASPLAPATVRDGAAGPTSTSANRNPP
jgi:hypothetical protein